MNLQPSVPTGVSARAPEALRLRLCQYNPQALPAHRGIREVLEGLETCHVISLTGTGQSMKFASFDGSLKILSPRVGEYTVWQWPTPKNRPKIKDAPQSTSTSGTNSSTG
eukprot:580227-Pyramimonas_sp.AAC.1